MIGKFQELIRQTSEIILDKQDAIRMAAIGLLAGGHLLIEDVPGVGKTTLVQTLGKLLGLQTHRVQFTVDLLPADLLGGHVFDPKDQTFRFHPGPIFSQVVLADELNRASPRTQSALLQAMEEGQVSLDGKTWDLPKPFLVIATQNPHQQMGTFPLPESQLDRFMLSLELNYASKNTEIKLFQTQDPRDQIQKLEPLFQTSDLITAQKQVNAIKVPEVVALYIANLLENSRAKGFQGTPLSTRAGLSITRAGKAWAFLQGRDYIRPEDIQAVIIPSFGHRLGGNHGLRQGRDWARQVLRETPVPV